jgi:hypothetical protein
MVGTHIAAFGWLSAWHGQGVDLRRVEKKGQKLNLTKSFAPVWEASHLVTKFHTFTLGFGLYGFVLFHFRHFVFRIFFIKRLPGVGSEPGSSQFHLFSHFHHFNAELQRLPVFRIFYPSAVALGSFFGRIIFNCPGWRRGAVDIASASGTRRPGFEPRQGIRLLGKHNRAGVFKMT